MLEYNGIISLGQVNHTQKVLANDGSEILTYYINNSNGWLDLDRGFKDLDGWKYFHNHITMFCKNHSEDEKIYINNIFERLDPLIDLDFERMSTNQGSDIDIYSITNSSSFASNVVGQLISQDTEYGAWVDIIWKKKNNKDFEKHDKNTIIHEIGHALGLSHPYEDPFNPMWSTDDTIMSYNKGKKGWGDWFTETDIYALQSIWGRENDNKTIRFEKNINNYRIKKTGSEEFAIESIIGDENITGIDEIIFKDKTLNLLEDIKGVFDQVKAINDITGKIYRLYNSALGRFPDSEGLEYWITMNETKKNTYKQTCFSFLLSNEYQTTYGENSSNNYFINALYKNVLNRSPDSEGFVYWENQLSSGTDTRADVLMSFSESFENQLIFSNETNIR